MEFCNCQRMLLVVLLSFCFWKQEASAACPQAIFAFGASQSDAGNSQSTYSHKPAKQTNHPYGMTFFNESTTRHSDGRVIVDFFSQAMRIPLLSPSTHTVDVDFTHGVNFAFAGVMTQDNNYTEEDTPPYFYSRQVQQFRYFKERTIEAWNNPKSKDGKLKASLMVSTIPDYFDTALYFTTFGTNDFVVPFFQLHQTIKDLGSDTAHNISKAMVDNTEELIKLGAKTIMVFNVPPLGCYPAFISIRSIRETPEADKYGCHKDLNAVITETNSQIEDGLADLRKIYTDATIIYADFYTVLFSLIKHGESHGFTQLKTSCCGRGYNDENAKEGLDCGHSKVREDGTSVTGTWCEDPGSYIHWDGLHITDAAAALVAKALLEGHHTYPPKINLSKLCQLDYSQF